MIGPGKVPTAKEAPGCREGTGMGGSQHQVVWISNGTSFTFRIVAPEEKYHWGIFLIQQLDYSISKNFPASAAVGMGLPGSHC